jgi:hypothetical protein
MCNKSVFFGSIVFEIDLGFSGYVFEINKKEEKKERNLEREKYRGGTTRKEAV